MPFLTPLKVKQISSGEWQLLEPLSYHYTPDNRIYTAPEGFVTDFASVPRIPLVYSAFGNTGHQASVIHDYLYSIKYNRKKADEIFLQALKEHEHPIRARIMYSAVRLFGRFFY